MSTSSNRSKRSSLNLGMLGIPTGSKSNPLENFIFYTVSSRIKQRGYSLQLGIPTATQSLDSPKTPAALAQKINPNWILASHLALLDATLVAVERGDINRLMVFLPPQHGKSSLISLYFPAWYIGRHPDKYIVLASYEATFAASWGGRARDIIRDYGLELFGVSLDVHRQASDWWWTSDGGYMLSAGVGGPITGKTASVAIIDDPIKNAEEANSAIDRQHKWEWLQSTLYTRLEQDASIILIMTRWHEDDLAGRLLSQMDKGGESWTVISLPAIAEDDDPLGRRQGDPLWPEKKDKNFLEAQQRAMGPYYWQAQYQQHPTPIGGGLFKRDWFRYIIVEDQSYVIEGKLIPIKECRRFVIVDLAFSERKSADYTVLASWAVTPDDDLLLLDIIRVRLEDELMAVAEGTDINDTGLLRVLWDLWRSFKPGWIGIEKTSIKLSLIEYAKKKGLPIRDLMPDKDKVSRAQSAIAKMSAGGIYFLRGASWLKEYEDELLSFPYGAHDDQVDVTSYAAAEVLRAVSVKRPMPRAYRI